MGSKARFLSFSYSFLVSVHTVPCFKKWEELVVLRAFIAAGSKYIMDDAKCLGDNLGHPIFDNLRCGDWLMDYTVSRLKRYVTTEKVRFYCGYSWTRTMKIWMCFYTTNSWASQVGAYFRLKKSSLSSMLRGRIEFRKISMSSWIFWVWNLESNRSMFSEEKIRMNKNCLIIVNIIHFILTFIKTGRFNVGRN